MKVIKNATELASTKEYNLGCPLSADIFVRNLADKYQAYIQRSYVRCPAFAAHVFGPVNDSFRLYYTDLSAIDYEMFACASGEDESKMTTFLEKHYKRGLPEADLIRIGISALLQSVGREAEHTEISVTVLGKNGTRVLDGPEIDKHLQDIAEN
ncbi:PSA [Enterospora canceri]|uniref:PSA n=1 Tax=Enterospora canceri TaxID=1081671 RepID=A0A1Y1S7F3_9MICR|nr:PSA [Enterospora canceri]